MKLFELKEQIEERWPGQERCNMDIASSICEIITTSHELPDLCRWIFEREFSYAGLVVEEGASEWHLRHVFYDRIGWVHVLASAPLEEKVFPSIVKFVHAADWHEREAEDLFGLILEGHPRLGDFVMHDDAWQENVDPMRRNFDMHTAMLYRKPKTDWRPHRIVKEPGAFVMPIGPKFSGVTESVHFLLETVGEDVIRFTPRLFYKWRAIEKLAEGKTVDEVLLLAERFAATTAFSHGLAFCQAAERICHTDVPSRAKILRVFLAELERLRQHAGAIQEICESTALVVSASQAGIFEEEMLRISCELTGHRYLFGMLAPGGLLCDLSDKACRGAFLKAKGILTGLDELESRLRVSSSFLDRIEEVGIVPHHTASAYGLLGPIARASGLVRDLRRTRPYSDYEKFQFYVPREKEGDGYARLRLLFSEARQSVRIMEQAVAALQEGPAPQEGHIRKQPQLRAGAAFGWVEAPRGAAFHWLRLDERGRVQRYHIIPPSFANWHGFHLAVEKFAFQDFPIMLSTFDLSVAENDR